jgi:hypothetical protein
VAISLKRLTQTSEQNAKNKVIEVGGPDNVTFNQVADLFEKLSGHPSKRNHIPLPMMRMLRVLARPFNPMFSLQITGGILMDTENMAYDMSATLQRYPTKLTRLEEIARRMSAKTIDAT